MQGVIVHEGKQTNLSLYGGELATQNEVHQAVNTLMAAFPQQPEAFYTVLTTVLMKSGMRREQLSNAVLNLIKNHPYPRFTPAELINFDKCIQLYTYREYIALCQQGYKPEHFVRDTTEEGITYWIKREDICRHALRTGSPAAKAAMERMKADDEAKRKEAAEKADEERRERLRKSEESRADGLSPDSTFAEIMAVARAKSVNPYNSKPHEKEIGNTSF
jgi:hypothetical protein